MGEVMQLDAEDASKFWPIYKEYEAELTRGGDEKLALIKKYADHYQNMTDAIADELASGALKLEQERHDLKAKYYGRIKQSLGTITAARFLQVENQLLMLLDLQVAALLPVVK
jgi:dsDNA-binding SOS-regulon protein